jgi:GT2 family glycosyltransferase/ADP-heptose:LPS heptosyltransferase
MLTSDSIFLSGGIGDFVVIDSYLTPAERGRVREVHLATRAGREIQSLMKALRDYKVRTYRLIVRDWTQPVSSKKDIPGIPAAVQDLSIGIVFPEIAGGKHPYRDSAFYRATLMHSGRRRSAVIQAASLTEPGIPGACLSREDWKAIAAWLDAQQADAVVIGSGDHLVPCHPRIHNGMNVCGVIEAAELVRSAKIYIGIDGWAAALAARDPAKTLRVKSLSQYFYDQRAIYLAPRSDTGFLTPTITFDGSGPTGPPPPLPNPEPIILPSEPETAPSPPVPVVSADSYPIGKPDAYLYEVPAWFTSQERPRVSIIVPMYRSAAVIADQINTWPYLEPDVEIVYVDDACPGNSRAVVVDNWLKRGMNRPVGQIVVNKANEGYAQACNAGAYYARGDYLVFLNADTRVTEGWLRPLIEILQDTRVGVVGNLQLKEGGPFHGTVDSAGSQWSWNKQYFEHIGRHVYGGYLSKPIFYGHMPDGLKVPAEREMVTGCCFALPRKLFEQVGGFDPKYRIGYWEDADLCLRIRELGYKVFFHPKSLIWHKLSHSGAPGHAFYEHNKERFYNRWVKTGRLDPYVFSKRPGPIPEVRTILVKRHIANGDVLLATCVLPALKKKYPLAQITFWTRFACAPVVAGNKYIDNLIIDGPGRPFDFIVDLDLAYEWHPYWPVTKAYAFEAGVPEEDCWVSAAVDPLPPGLQKPYVVMHVKHDTSGWVGRRWSHDGFMEIAHRLRALGHFVVCLGVNGDYSVPCDLDLRGKTTPKGLAGVIQEAGFFVGVNSMPMCLAAAMGVPGVVFFGSVAPEVWLYGSKLVAVRSENVPCLACHQRKRPPSVGTSECARGDLACERDLTVDIFWKKIEGTLQCHGLRSK